MTAALNLYAAAEKAIEDEAALARGQLASNRDHVARFEALCGVLAEHGLEFKPRVHAFEYGVQYWISIEDTQAPEMLLTLAALDCNENEGVACYLNTPNLTAYAITGPHAPDFNLIVTRAEPASRAGPIGRMPYQREACHAP